MDGCGVFDAQYASLITTMARYNSVHIKKFKLYIPRTRNVELDDILNDIIERALKGYDFLQCFAILQDESVAELRRRNFGVDIVSGSNVIQWYAPEN